MRTNIILLITGKKFQNAKRAFAALCAASLLQCGSLLGSADDGDEESLALLAVAFASQCSLGGVSFAASGVACGLSGASGTGTLTALQSQTSFVSMLVNFQLLNSSGSLSLVAGLNPSRGVATQNVGGELAVSTTVSKKPQDAGAGAAGAGTTAQTWCFEIHVDESPTHAILDQTGNCTAKSATAASYENDANGPSRDGGLWGFVLNNATITGITVNDRKLFTE